MRLLNSTAAFITVILKLEVSSVQYNIVDTWTYIKAVTIVTL